MMKNIKKLTALLLALVLSLGLCACAGDPAETEPEAAETEEAITAVPAETDAPAPAETEIPAADEPDSTLPVSVMVLNGTTGFGMAKLMSDAENGETALNYTFSVESDASAVTAALISGDCDIAALPTNAAATVYNKTQGGVQTAAVNTLGVLYLVENSEAVSIAALSDLEGMTVYVPAQNPTFIFRALAEAAGVNVTIDNTYAQPADLQAALASGEIDLAVLPEPMVTIARSSNEALAVALDLTAEWDAAEPAGSLMQGCVVVSTAFAHEHPAEVNAFLEEYGASIAYLTENPAEAAQLIEQTGVFSKAAVAEKAIPNCNVCFITGTEMRDSLNAFLEILYAVEPSSVGGAVPGEDFYYLG